VEEYRQADFVCCIEVGIPGFSRESRKPIEFPHGAPQDRVISVPVIRTAEIGILAQPPEPDLLAAVVATVHQNPTSLRSIIPLKKKQIE
jgi:hypothetical protein